MMKTFRVPPCGVVLFFCLLSTSPLAYNGSEAWLHYTAVPEGMKAGYQAVCKSLVLSDAASDTLKNAQTELDLAMPKLLGGSKLPVADGAGAIVLAPEGSSPVSSSGIDYSKVTDEGYIIKSSNGKTYITGKNQVAVLRGVFHFLRLMQTAKPIDNLDVVENPYFPYRVLDHWINHYGSNVETERVYGGGRVFKMENFGNLQGAEKTRVINYCRLAVSLGLNGICPDNVNTYRQNSLGNYRCLEESNLKNQKAFADLIGTYGLNYYLSVSYASPRLVSPTYTSANAWDDPKAKQWWFDKVAVVISYIKNFGGFLMKADSEGEEGPRSTYKLNQSQGANPMAEALRKHGKVMIWRTFIYDTSDPDFAINQSKEFEAQTWDDAVILRSKDGPRDFQTVEPPNQLLAMGGVRHGMEFQITQEYTGQDKHVCWLVPKWKQILDWDIKGATLPPFGAEGTITRQLLRGPGTATSGGGVWGISNLSDAANWTGHFIAQANYYGYGRLSWNPLLSADQIADEWIRCSFDKGNDPAVLFIVKNMLMKSWKTYEDYTISYSALMPALGNDTHYEIGFEAMRSSRFYTVYFMNLTGDGIGVDRTPSGNNMVRYFPKVLADSFATVTSCPEDYLLFFHHCKWEYKMKSGMTLIQSLYHNHFRGLKQVRNFINNWKLLSGTVDAEIHSHVTSKLNTQNTDAKRWVNTFKSDFGSKYSTAVGCDLSIMIPDETKAVTLAVGGSVTLSSKYTDQKGAAVSETIRWRVCREREDLSPEEGGVLSASEGASVTFSADCDGVYRVTASTATFPDLTDQIQIFVGDWANGCPSGIGSSMMGKPGKLSMNIINGPRGIVISTPCPGKIDIVGLQGRIVRSISANKPGTYFWNTGETAKGLYLIRLRNEMQSLRSKLIVK
ncbi:MAG: hypothetical protein JXA18_04485 [Chitinispirillaceae bacterium]|nr:hypothetical protein [Chitinispirillaceae bacterium]